MRALGFSSVLLGFWFYGFLGRFWLWVEVGSMGGCFGLGFGFWGVVDLCGFLGCDFRGWVENGVKKCVCVGGGSMLGN